jgi:hypothetical protein
MSRTTALAALAAGLAVSAVYAQVMRPVLRIPNEYATSVAVDRTGSVIYATTSTNQFGTNPTYRTQIVRWDPVTGAGIPITDCEEGVESVSVSDDGSWIAFVSAADLLGTNHDESPELYVMHADGTGLVQLTAEAEGWPVRSAVISGSANRIAFIGDIDPLGTNPNTTALFVIDRDGTNLRQLRTDVLPVVDENFEPYPTAVRALPSFGISDDGSKVVYSTRTGGFFGINADGTGDHAFSGTASPRFGGISIAGNGTKIIYTTRDWSSSSVSIRTFDGDPATIVTLGEGERASLTDDASAVLHYGYNPDRTVVGTWRRQRGRLDGLVPDLRLRGRHAGDPADWPRWA